MENDIRDNKGRFGEGNSGKPEGAISKKTKLQNKLVAYIDGEGLETFIKGINELLNSPDEGTRLKALAIFKDIIEFSLPKLQRTEITGKGGEDLITEITIKHVYPNGQPNDTSNAGI